MKTLFDKICTLLSWPFSSPLVKVGYNTSNIRYVKAYIKNNVGIKKVYNLQVGNGGTYIANGFHVHNCDYHTGVDLYGMGAGVYPVGDKAAIVPDFPFHPACLCGSEYVYSGETAEKTASDYSKKAGEKYLKSLPESERKAILGVGGNEKFKENPKSWAKNKNMQNVPTEKKPTIPAEVLYGE